MKVKLSVDTHCIKDTPKANIPYGVISKTIGNNPRELTLEEIAEAIKSGYTINSPIYRNGIRKKENIIEMQLFILDFDGKDSCVLSYSDALKRAECYDLPVVISYETKSSVNLSRYRLIFMYNEPVCDIRIMDIINRLLLHIFPEADSTTKDLSKIFLPGRNVRLHGGKPFHFDKLIVAARSHCLAKSKYSKSTWVDLLKNFSTVYGLVITGTDIFINDNINPSELHTFAFQSIYFYMDNNSKVCKNDRIKYVYFVDTVKDKDTKIKLTITTGPLQLRKLSSIKDECALMCSFEEGIRLPHDQWFGLATNLINIKGGQNLFTKIINSYGNLYGNVDFKTKQMEYAARMNYKPQSCADFCPYSDECPHSENMILTLKDKRHRMKRIKGYSEQFEDVDSIKKSIRNFFYNAVSNKFAVNILKAPTGSGKSTEHLEFLKHFDNRTINAYPNSRLMLEKYNAAVSMGINAVYTPIIDDLYQYLTAEQGEQIKSLYEIGAGELPIRLLKQWSNGIVYNDHKIAIDMKLPKSHIETDSYVAVQLLEKSGELSEETLAEMAEKINGPFVFTVLDERNNSYFVKGDNPLALYHFKDGFYAYASTDQILESALDILGLSALSFAEINSDCGDILKIDSEGKLMRSQFQPSIVRSYYCYTPVNLNFRRACQYDIPEEYIDLMLDYGYTLEDVEDLCGIPEAIETTVSEILCEYGYCDE